MTHAELMLQSSPFIGVTCDEPVKTLGEYLRMSYQADTRSFVFHRITVELCPRCDLVMEYDWAVEGGDLRETYFLSQSSIPRRKPA